MTIRSAWRHRSALMVVSAIVACALEAWSATPPHAVRVVMDNDYAPFAFRSDTGALQGILIDQWRLWEQQTGITVTIDATDWGEALRRMRAGEFDVIDSIVETPERHAYFDFTSSYTAIEASIYFRKDISGLTELASLRGFPVGVKDGDQHIDQLKASGVTTLILFPNNDAIVQAAKDRKINTFVVDDPSALYLLNKMGIEDEFRHSAPIFRDGLRRAVRKGDAELLRVVSSGFAAIPAREFTLIEEKWFGRTINGFARYLTYAAYLTFVVVALVAGLAGWNRTLRQGILQRTAALGDSERRFRQIAVRLMHMQDDERRRIARMLHETTAQDLAALKMQLSGVYRTATALTDAERAALGESLVLAEQSIAEIRTMSYLLHPPFLDEAGLRSALRWYATGFAQRSGITVDVELPEVFTRLPLDTETALFRIVQESLTNIHRHAGSVRARIRLQRNDRTLVLEIEDQGRGIPPPLLAQITRGGAGVGVGIAGMRERIEQLGGRLDVASGERGTTVRASLPIAQARQ